MMGSRASLRAASSTSPVPTASFPRRHRSQAGGRPASRPENAGAAHPTSVTSTLLREYRIILVARGVVKNGRSLDPTCVRVAQSAHGQAHSARLANRPNTARPDRAHASRWGLALSRGRS